MAEGQSVDGKTHRLETWGGQQSILGMPGLSKTFPAIAPGSGGESCHSAETVSPVFSLVPRLSGEGCSDLTQLFPRVRTSPCSFQAQLQPKTAQGASPTRCVLC